MVRGKHQIIEKKDELLAQHAHFVNWDCTICLPFKCELNMHFDSSYLEILDACILKLVLYLLKKNCKMHQLFFWVYKMNHQIFITAIWTDSDTTNLKRLSSSRLPIFHCMISNVMYLKQEISLKKIFSGIQMRTYI